MRQVVAAVLALTHETQNGYLCRALETAIVVCYSRAFAGGNEIGALGTDAVPTDPDMRRLHEELLRLRDQVYAHIDRRVAARDIEDVGALLGLEKTAYTEWWRPIDRAVLPALGALAKHQEERFANAAVERERSLDE